ncbi:MAG: hypothetical protein IPM51_11830 [Sphingobacteriaceae bacterium]|nr:hypothetical protein [Sphingobacteriaceae bacterium]
MSEVLDQAKIGWGEFVDPHDRSKGKNFPLHNLQSKVYLSDHRFTAAIAGTGGGKTVTGPLWIARQIERFKKVNPHRPILGMVIAPTYKVLSRATVPTLINTFKDTPLEGIYKESRSYYELPKINGVDGGIIWCQGADNPGGLEGGQFDFIWGDEAGQFKYNVWIAIQGRTGLKRSPILLTTTPYGKNWLYHHFYKAYKEGNPDYYVVQWPSNANPAYSTEEYERAKSVMSGELGTMRYDGEFSGIAGLVYRDIGNCFTTLSPSELSTLLSKPGTFHGGIDFGWNDPFCALSGFLEKERDILWVWFERYKSKTPIEVHADKLPKFVDRSIKWYCDHNPELIQKLKRGGHLVAKAEKNILAGINAVNHRIYTDRLKIVSNRCKAVVAESEMYKYPDEEDKMGGDVPIDDFNHAMDALRYMIMGIDRKRAA